MKTKSILLSTALTIVLTLPAFGQSTHDDKTGTAMQRHEMSKMMGKPTVAATVEGLHMKVWLMTQKQRKAMMKGKMGQMMMGEDMKEMKDGGMQMKDTSMGMGKEMKRMKHDRMAMRDTSTKMNEDMKKMKHGGMGMDQATKEAMMAGTHCIMLEVTDEATGKGIADATAKVMDVSPSKIHSSVELKPMMSHFGAGLTLDEKGVYEFTVTVNVGGVPKTTPFRYTVK